MQTFEERRAEEMEVRDPTCANETLSYMLQRAQAIGAGNILEIGAGKGFTSIAFAKTLPSSRVTAIERDAVRAAAARENIRDFGVEDRVRLLEGDAADILPTLGGTYDVIFLDAAKVQYRRFFTASNRLLRAGGVLFSDDVMLFSDGVPKKRRMLAMHLQEYMRMLREDADLSTTVHGYGMGLAESVKLR